MNLKKTPIDDENLNKLLRRCGHFLYHQTHHDQQSTVLTLLAEYGPMNQKQLQEHLSIKAGSVSELISKLESKNCLIRTRDDADRRRVVLTLTEKGTRIAKLHRERPVETLFADLSPEERAELAGLLEKLLAGWGI